MCAFLGCCTSRPAFAACMRMHQYTCARVRQQPECDAAGLAAPRVMHMSHHRKGSNLHERFNPFLNTVTAIPCHTAAVRQPLPGLPASLPCPHMVLSCCNGGAGRALAVSCARNWRNPAGGPASARKPMTQ